MWKDIVIGVIAFLLLFPWITATVIYVLSVRRARKSFSLKLKKRVKAMTIKENAERISVGELLRRKNEKQDIDGR